MKKKNSGMMIGLSVLICATPVFADVIIDGSVSPSTVPGLVNNTGSIRVGSYISGTNGTLEVNANATVNGYTALQVGDLSIGNGAGGTVKIIGDGTAGSARIDISRPSPGGWTLDNGYGGNGTLEIRNGGVLESRGGVVTLGGGGLISGGDAVTTIDGQGSVFRTIGVGNGYGVGHRINIGGFGSAVHPTTSTVNITNGGLMEAQGDFIGGDFASVWIGGSASIGSNIAVNVAGEGSTLRAGNYIDLGSSFANVNSSLNVTDGGQVEVTGSNPYGSGNVSMHIVTLAGAADVTVSGASTGGVASSLVTAGDIRIGGHSLVVGFTEDGVPYTGNIPSHSSEGQATTSDGRLLFRENGDPIPLVPFPDFPDYFVPDTVVGDPDLEIHMKSTGSLVVENGARVEANAIHVSENGVEPASTYNGQGATLAVRSGASVTADVYVNEGGLLTGDGSIIGDVFVQGGTVGPGNSPGVLTITGDLTLESDSVLLMEIFGPTAYDQLIIGGNFVAGGILELDFGGYMPEFDVPYDLFQVAGGMSGDFSEIKFLNPAAGFDAGLLSLSFASGENGGMFQLIMANNGDPGNNTVPEPASGLLIGLGGLAMLMLRRRSPRISLA